MNFRITGIHHVAIKAKGLDAYAKLIEFYHGILGMPIIREWGEGDNLGAMVDTGAGILELFSNAPDVRDAGALRHLALRCDNPDECIESVRAKGYEVTMEPKDIVIASNPPYPARIAFCIGPVGEEVEFFAER